MNESPTTRPGPGANPPGDSPTPAAIWSADLAELRRTYGQTWLVERVKSDPFAVTVTRKHGTHTHVMAGPPGELLRRLDAMPKAPPAPAADVVITDEAGWISGSMGGAA